MKKLTKKGLFGYALYQLSQGQYDQAFQSVMAALAVFGVKHALVRQDNEVADLKAKLTRKE